MITYTLTLDVESPLAVSADRSDRNRLEMADAVPPPTVRGALAARMRQTAPSDEEAFLEAFGPTGCRTSALHTVHGSGAVRPAPQTILSCKHRPGSEEEGGHGIYESLFASTRFALAKDADGLDALQSCPVCGNVLRPLRKPVQRTDSGVRLAPDPERTVQTHNGIDRRRGGSASGILYSREVMQEGQQIAASVTAPKSVMKWLEAGLQSGALLDVGTAVSRGLGRCRVVSFEPAPAAASIEERLDRFNDAAVAAGVEPDGELVALTLETPGLFVDPFLRSRTQPAGADLLQDDTGEAHRQALGALEWVHQVARPFQFAAWNGVARMPYAALQGIEAGSVLLYRLVKRTDDLLAALAHAEAHGVGLQRHLGLGRVRICDPLHSTLPHSTEPTHA